MENPRFKCQSILGPKLDLELRLDKPDRLNICLLDNTRKYDTVLLAEDVANLVDQLRSWLALRTWLKPKKRFVVCCWTETGGHRWHNLEADSEKDAKYGLVGAVHAFEVKEKSNDQ